MNLLDTKFVWEDGTAVMQCRDRGKWRTMTKFEIRNNMASVKRVTFDFRSLISKRTLVLGSVGVVLLGSCERSSRLANPLLPS